MIDPFLRHQTKGKFVERGADDHYVSPLKSHAERRRRRRESKMGAVGQKRLHGLRSAGDKDDFRIQFVLGKELQFGKRPQRSLKTRDAAVCNDDVFVGPCYAAQQKKNDCNDSKNAAQKSIPHGRLAPMKTLSVIFTITTDCQDYLRSHNFSQTLMACECRVDTP